MLLFIICSKHLLADDLSGGAIKGTITTSDGKPVADITVSIRENKRGTLTNEQGEYLIKNIKPGAYTLEISAIGIVPQQETIVVQENETVGKDFTINLSAQQLQDVLVSTARGVHTQPSSTLRLNTSLIETPQNITVTGQQTIKDIGGLTLSDILRTSSGTYNGDGASQSIYIAMRGNSGGTNQLRNGIGAGYSFNSSPDVGMIDRVEFIKGPASFMVSNTDPSGLVNIVTKQPVSKRIADVNFGYGSYNMMRAAIDFGGALTKDSALTYRLNAGIQDQDQYYQFGYYKKNYVAGALNYKIDEATNVTVEYNRVYEHSMSTTNMIPEVNGTLFTLARNFTALDPNEPGIATFDNYYRLDAVHKFNDNWSLHAQASVVSGNWSSFVLNGDHMSVDYDTLYRYINHNRAYGSMYTSQVFLSGSFNTGKDVKHKLLLGADYGKVSRSWSGTNYDDDENSLSLYMPDPTYYLPIDTFKNYTWTSVSTTINRYTAFFAQDAVTFFDKVIFSFGGRFTRNIEDLNSAPYQIKDNKFTPRVGLTYLFTPNVSAYAMFDQAFVPQTGTDFNGKAFKPMYGSDREIGFKGYFFNNALSVNAAVYEIVENNNLTSDLQHSGFSIQTGQIKNKGVELDIDGNITKQLRIMANYAYTDAKITKDNTPSNLGMPNWGSIPNTANLFLKYTFTDKVLKGLSIGAGAQYMDKAYWNADLIHTLPSYTLFEASFGYSVRKFYVNVNAYNLTNKRYATYGYMYSDKDWLYQPGEPSNFRIDFGIHL